MSFESVIMKSPHFFLKLVKLKFSKSGVGLIKTGFFKLVILGWVDQADLIIDRY